MARHLIFTAPYHWSAQQFHNTTFLIHKNSIGFPAHSLFDSIGVYFSTTCIVIIIPHSMLRLASNHNFICVHIRRVSLLFRCKYRVFSNNNGIVVSVYLCIMSYNFTSVYTVVYSNVVCSRCEIVISIKIYTIAIKYTVIVVYTSIFNKVSVALSGLKKASFGIHLAILTGDSRWAI